MRPGFAFSTRFRVRYAEIDGQKVVFNSRYLEYADAAVSEWWEWTGIDVALGEAWRETEFHVRRAEVDYLKPFAWGDVVEAWVRLERVGGSSLVQRFELLHGETGELHARIELVVVNVHLPTGRPAPIADEVRVFLEALIAGQPERVA
ncbi:4-hydroxybenzoyl-CoA thioesterase [Sphingomonas lenta]|uniref:4-hydroxybenzoyl-CoA thioesterase n=2 Tax=Sphingomonas lenta TaxID=1141887 RepID=A0A2A2SDV8_9SPHN|nr:thioesterase family protein [Sphingomonas lenta]PAX07437.1 4-hydroxybenzoyl-CoA thioesterase [Sphingomonas lenta]